MRRLRRILLWGTLALVLLVALAAHLALNTSLSERLAEHFLTEALKRGGGAMAIASRKGSLAGGLDLQGVEVTLPPTLHFTARRVHLRLSRSALLSGTLLVEDLTLKDPRVEILVPKAGEAGRGKEPPPSWLRIYAPRISITGGEVVLRNAGNTPEKSQVWSGITLRGDGTWFMQRLSLRLASLRVSPPAPLPSPISASGVVEVTAGGSGRADVAVTAPRSSVKMRGGWKYSGEALSYHASSSFDVLALREVAFGWPSAPDLVLGGHAKVEGDGHGVTCVGEVASEALGPVTLTARAQFVSGGADLSGTLRTAGATLSPFWKTPRGREAKVSGEGAWSLRFRGGEPPKWEARADLGPSSVWGILLDSALLKGSGTSEEIEVKGEWAAALTGRGRGWARVHRASGTWEAEVSSSGVRVFDLLRQLGLDVPLPSAVHPPDGPWDVSRIAMSGTAGALSLDANGSDPAGAKWTFALDPMGDHFTGCSIGFEGMDPSAFDILPGKPGRFTGSARYAASGPTSGELEVQISRGEWAGATLQPMAARLGFAPGVVTLAPLDVRTNLGEVKLSGSLFKDGRIEGPLQLVIPDVSKLQPLLGRAVPSGTLKATLDLGGKLSSPRVRGEIALTDARWGQVLLKEGKIKGLWDPAGEGSNLSVGWTGLDVAGQALGAGDLKLSGKAESLHAELDAEAGADRRLALRAWGRAGRDGLDLDVKEGHIEALGRRFDQEGQARLKVDREEISWSGFTIARKEGRLSTAGRIGMEGPMATAPISGTLAAKHFPLALLPIPSTAGKVSGFVNADLSWSGRVDKPVLHGSAELVEGAYRYADSDRVIMPITASFRAEGDRLTLAALRATTPEGGEATGTGFVRFEGFWPEEFRFEAKGTDFPFIIGRDMDGVADFTAVVRGTLAEPFLEGTAHVKNGRIQLPEMERRKALPESVRFVNAPPGSPYAQPPQTGPSLVGPLRGSVKLDSSGGLWISSKNLLAELGGALTVRFTPRGPAVGGSLEILQGRFFFEGKKFELHDSRVSFDGTTSLTPYLNIVALYRVQDTDVEVHLTGLASKPDLLLTSSPPLEQSDILSLLVVGRTSKDLRTGDSQTVSSSAAGAVALYGATPILDQTKDALGLDSMSIGVGASPQVALSKSLGDRTVLEYQQTFGALPEWWVNLRYRYDRHWSVQASGSSKGTTGMDLFWEARY